MKSIYKVVAALLLMMVAVWETACQKEGDIKIHTYVDLGLPSGTLWATTNVGADSPEKTGDRFAWGEILTKDAFTKDNYKYYSGEGYTKYSVEIGLDELLPEDDAALVQWQGDWRMPTYEDWSELVGNTTQSEVVKNGVTGRMFTGRNGRSVFMPMTVGVQDESRNDAFYWSCSLLQTEVSWCLGFNAAGVASMCYYPREMGGLVRPVRSK